MMPMPCPFSFLKLRIELGYEDAYGFSGSTFNCNDSNIDLSLGHAKATAREYNDDDQQ